MAHGVPTFASNLGPSDGSLRLLGEINGQWTDVDGIVAYTQDFTAIAPAIGRLQVLLRGFVATREASSNRYHVDWDRRVYWLNFDGDGPAIPHLLGALELASSYVPAADDSYPEFNSLPSVTTQCTATNPCSVNWTPYVLYRDQTTDYSSYPEGAAEADLLFVANAAGDAIAVSLDLHDAAGEPSGTTTLNSGDELQLSTIGYKLDEPGFVYIVSYMDFVTIDAGVRIERQHYTPGVDFVDPNLLGFNASSRSIKFLLDAISGEGAAITYAFGGPFALGFNWAQAPEFLFRGNFEPLVADGVSTGIEP
jgi:hypothetical protein